MKIYNCIEISEGSLSGNQVFKDVAVAVKWANEVTAEYYTEDSEDIPPEVTAKDLETEFERELPGDEMNQSRIHITPIDF